MTTPGAVIEVSLAWSADGGADLDRVVGLLRDLATAEPTVDHDARTIGMAVTDDLSTLAEIARRLAASDVPVEEMHLRRPPTEPPSRPIGGPGRPIKRSGPRPGARRPEAAASAA